MRSFLNHALAISMLATGCATARVPAAHNHTISVPVDGGLRRVPVSLDLTQINPTGDHTVKPIAPARGNLLLVLDSYASRPQPLSRCKAGNEKWVRLIDLRNNKELSAHLVESCLNNVDHGDPPATWDADGSGFTINILSKSPIHVVVDPSGLVHVGG